MLFQNPFFFEGRIRRTEYALSYGIYIAFTFCLLAIIDAGGSEIGALLLLAPMIWFMFAQGAKRCHNRNNSGFYQFIPFYNLWMLFGAGDEGENKYGPDPKTIEDLNPNEY